MTMTEPTNQPPTGALCGNCGTSFAWHLDECPVCGCSAYFWTCQRCSDRLRKCQLICTCPSLTTEEINPELASEPQEGPPREAMPDEQLAGVDAWKGEG